MRLNGHTTSGVIHKPWLWISIISETHREPHTRQFPMITFVSFSRCNTGSVIPRSASSHWSHHVPFRKSTSSLSARALTPKVRELRVLRQFLMPTDAENLTMREKTARAMNESITNRVRPQSKAATPAFPFFKNKLRKLKYSKNIQQGPRPSTSNTASIQSPRSERHLRKQNA